MKMRAFLLIAILFGGTYMMLQSYNDYKVKEFDELFGSINEQFDSLLFYKPTIVGSVPDSWIVEDEAQIENLVQFLQQYHLRKLKPEEINTNNQTEQFSVSLQNETGNSIRIIATEGLIIENSLVYYEIVDGPLNVDWLVQFFVRNQIGIE